MVRHYLTFTRQAELLHEKFADQVLAQCWSQEKNRLLLRFIRGTESSFMEISLDLQIGYALPSQEIHRAKKNTLDFFESLLGTQLNAVTMHETERIIQPHFAGAKELLIVFFGPGAGNVLLRTNKDIVESFHEVGDEYDNVLDVADEEILTRDALIAELLNRDVVPSRALTSVLRRLGKRLAHESLFQAGIPDESTLSELPESQLLDLLDHVDSLYSECLTSEVFRLYFTEDDVIFALVPLKHLENKRLEKVEEFEDLAKAVRVYRGTSFRRGQFRSTKVRMAKHVEKDIRRLERSLEHTGKAEQHTERAEGWELTGNVLLANLHGMQRGQEEIELTDWEGTEFKIKLDPKMTPAENAERYFRKARGARNEIDHAERRAASMRERLKILNTLKRNVERAETVKALEEIRNNNTKLFQVKGEAKEKGSAERFRRFVVEGEHEVYAGKSAANNDELTLRFARPNDIWLHARGASGSHVVLRWHDFKGRPPKRTLEEAAMVAAYYSGAKNSKLVPVAWTYKKYVRKPKGAAPGSVVMGREEVVLVEPRLPGSEG